MIVLEAVNQDDMALQYALEFQNNHMMVLEAVKRSGLALQYAPIFQNNREIVLAAVRRSDSALRFASPILMNNPEFMLLLHQNTIPSSIIID